MDREIGKSVIDIKTAREQIVYGCWGGKGETITKTE